MTYTFDPRHTWMDNAETLERALIEQAKIPTKPTVQQAHLSNLARLKSDLSALGRRCRQCDLVLHHTSKALFCATCLARRKLAQNSARSLLRTARRINGKFVGQSTLAPKPELP